MSVDVDVEVDVDVDACVDRNVTDYLCLNKLPEQRRVERSTAGQSRAEQARPGPKKKAELS